MQSGNALRGAKVRDGLKWSKKINEMLVTWGEETEVAVCFLLIANLG